VGRHALLVASGEYSDQTLSRLRAPAQDVGRLSALLEDPEIGGFDSVTVLSDAPDHVIRRAIEDAAATRLRGDLLLVYFSCHGVVDRLGRLHFASTDTDVTRPASTAVSNSFLNDQMESSLASAKVLVLDCCYSGAFAEGFKAGEGAALDGRVGEGYVVLSACDRYEFALEGTDIIEVEERSSLFTDVLVEGISSGNADLDGDGKIEVFELFRYVSEGVLARTPRQTPRSWAASAGPDIHLASVPTRHPVSADLASGSGGSSRAPMTSNYRRNQAILARGMRASTDLIRQTMGPVGRRSMFVDETGHNVELADARAVAAHFRPDDPRDRLGAGYIAQLVEEVHATAGSHGATAAVLAQALTDGVAAALRNGSPPVSLSRQINAAVEVAIERLAAQARPVDEMTTLQALTLAVRDNDLVYWLALAIQRVGAEGVIVVEESNVLAASLERAEGTWLPFGYVSPYFVTDAARSEAVLLEPYVLVLADDLVTVAPILPLLEKVKATGRPLMMIADKVTGEALTTLIVNKVRGTFASAAIEVPEGRAAMTDVAVVTGATVVTETSQLEALELDSLGSARKVVIGSQRSDVIEGAGNPTHIQDHLDQLTALVNAPESTQPERDAAYERYFRIAVGSAVLRVGAPTEQALHDRLEATKRAVRFARVLVSGGVVPGAGIGLLRVSEQMSLMSGDPGIRIVAAAVAAPLAQLLENAELPLTEDTRSGFNALTGQTGSAEQMGLLDAADALAIALRSAAQLVHRFLLTS
jgi:chaperonin GroEL